MAESVIDVIIRLKDETRAALRNVKTGLQGARTEAERLGKTRTDGAIRSLEDLKRATDAVKKSAEDAARGYDKVARSASKIAAVGAAGVAGFGAAAVAAGKFQTEIQEIATLVPDVQQTNEQLRDTVLDLSNEFGADRADVASALYQAISSGAAAGADATDLLRVSLETARGGVTDVRSAVDGLTTVLNAFQLETSQARDVADSLFTTVRFGRTTVGELSKFLFNAAPVAANLGVKFTELNAAVAAVTLQGVPTSQAFTQIRASLIGLARGTPEVNAALGDFRSVAESIRKIGLPQTLENIRKAAKGNDAELVRLVGSIEALNGILALTGPNLKNFTKQIENQDKRLGAIKAASDEVAESFGVQLQIATNRVSNAFVQLGETIIPVIKPLVQQVGELALAFAELLKESERAQTITQFALGLTALVTAFGTLVAVSATVGKAFVLLKGQFAATAITLKAVKTGAVGASFGMRVLARAINLVKLALGPIGIAIGLLTLAFSAFAEEADDVSEAVKLTRTNILSLNDIERIQVLEQLSADVETLTQKVKEQTQAVLDLRRARAEGSFFEKLFTTQGDIDEATEKLTEYGQQLEETQGKVDSLEEALLDTATIARIAGDETGLTELREEAVSAEEGLSDLRQQLEDAKKAADAFVPGETRKIFPEPQRDEFGNIFDPTIRVPEQAEGFRTDQEKSTIADLEQQIRLREESVRLLNEQIKRADALIDAEKAIQEKKDQEEEIAETRRELRRRLREEEQLLKAQNRLELSTAQAGADAIIDQNKRVEEELTASFENRKISAKQYYEELERLAVENAEAELQVLETRLAQLEGERDAAIEASRAGQGTDAERERIRVQFEAQSVELQAQIDAVVARLKAGLEGLGREAVEGTLTELQDTLTRIQTTQSNAIQLAQAQLEAGAITTAKAQKLIGDASKEATAQLEALLAAVERLIELDPDNFELQQLATQLKIAIADAEAAVNSFNNTLGAALEGELSQFFETILTDINDVGEAFDNLIAGIANAIKKLIAEKLANRLIESLFGGDGTGSVLGQLIGGSGGGSVGGAYEGGYIQASSGGFVAPKRSLVQGRRTSKVYVSSGVQYVKAHTGGSIYEDQLLKAATGGSVRKGKPLPHVTSHLLKAADGGSVVQVGDRLKTLPTSLKRFNQPVQLIEPETKNEYVKAKSGGILKAAGGGRFRTRSVQALQTGGGTVRGPGTSTSDSIPAMLSDGEYVVKASAVRHYGVQALEAINRRMVDLPDFQRVLSITKPRVHRFATGGLAGGPPSVTNIRETIGSPQNMRLEVSESTLNITMRDFLEREFASILATR